MMRHFTICLILAASLGAVALPAQVMPGQIAPGQTVPQPQQQQPQQQQPAAPQQQPAVAPQPQQPAVSVTPAGGFAFAWPRWFVPQQNSWWFASTAHASM
jgi:hypothetical protein